MVVVVQIKTERSRRQKTTKKWGSRRRREKRREKKEGKRGTGKIKRRRGKFSLLRHGRTVAQRAREREKRMKEDE